MKLDEWAETVPIVPTRNKSGAVSMPYSPILSLSARQNYLLYHLEDYVVSGLSGGAIWLCPRNTGTGGRAQ